MKFIKELNKLQAERELLKTNAEAQLQEAAANVTALEEKAAKAKSAYFLTPGNKTEGPANEAVKAAKDAKTEYEVKAEVLSEMKRPFLLTWGHDQVMDDVKAEWDATKLEDKVSKYKELYAEIMELEADIKESWNKTLDTYNNAAYNFNRLFMELEDRTKCVNMLNAFLLEKYQGAYTIGGLRDIRMPNIHVPKDELERYGIGRENTYNKPF